MLTTRSFKSGNGVFSGRCKDCVPCPQHLLNLLPLPQGQGSFLPVITLASNKINRLTDPTFDGRSDLCLHSAFARLDAKPESNLWKISALSDEPRQRPRLLHLHPKDIMSSYN